MHCVDSLEDTAPQTLELTHLLGSGNTRHLHVVCRLLDVDEGFAACHVTVDLGQCARAGGVVEGSRSDHKERKKENK